MPQNQPAAAPPFNIVKLANAQIFDEQGKKLKFGSLWQRQTTVFIFLRQFACIACRTHARQVWSEREKYEKNGARIVFIGNGNPDFIGKFKEDLKITDAPVYTDPELASFRAAGFKRGFLAALGPKSLVSGVKMFTSGGTQGEYTEGAGDLWQMGGIVVVHPTGVVAFHYISEALGDYPPHTDIPGGNGSTS